MKKRKIIDVHYRLTDVPVVSLPFSVRSIGHYVVRNGYCENKPEPSFFVQIYWGVSGVGQFMLNDKKYLFKPGYVFIYPAGAYHKIKCLSEEWSYRWFTFDGVLAEKIIESFNFPKCPFHAGTCPEELFIKLTSELNDSSPYGLRKIGATAYEIIAAIGGTPQAADRNEQLVLQCIELIRETYDEPETGISLLADELGVHRSTLNRAFKEKMNMSPLKYLTGFRVQKALSMLRTTTYPIAEVGRLSGYPDPCYFSKLIKEAVGVSPEKFRQS